MNLKIAKKLGGCLMALTLAIGCVSSVAVTADETDSKLSVSSRSNRKRYGWLYNQHYGSNE